MLQGWPSRDEESEGGCEGVRKKSVVEKFQDVKLIFGTNRSLSSPCTSFVKFPVTFTHGVLNRGSLASEDLLFNTIEYLYNPIIKSHPYFTS